MSLLTITAQIAAELKVREAQVQTAVDLLDGGATVPFISRYRKEATGGLDDVQMRELEARLAYLRELKLSMAAEALLSTRLRVLYDVDHAQGLEPWDLVWSTANFTFIPTEESALDKRMYTVTNFGTGLCGGYAVGSFETRNATSESGILSCFVDIPLHSNPAKMRTLWIGDLNNYDAKASLKVELPDAAQPITIAADTSIAMKGGPWFHYDLTDEERKAFPDGTFNITAIRIEPLAVSIVGSDYESEPRNLSRYNVQGRVKLYRADGSEITYGWDGNFFQGQYSPTVLRVDS